MSGNFFDGDIRRQLPEQSFKYDTTDINWTSPHVACILLLDTSGSMNDNGKIEALNKGLQSFKEQLYSSKFDKNKLSIIDIALVTFGGDGVQVEQYFLPAGRFSPPTLTANGHTPLCEAIIYSLALIEKRKKTYDDPNEVGCGHQRPWLFCITDGMPTDIELFSKAKEELQSYIAKKKVMALCTAVDDFDTSKMVEMFGIDNCLRLEGLDFADYFKFLSNSISSIGDSAKDGKNGANITETLRTRFMGDD
ncbi:MAG: hypothetical protein LBM93_03650 [Oscillospiraceae bacterium]|jgi:uncharacterized protein YegL|nr:hypothetical protein [Oscillospiraceae bacterium]